MDVADALDAIRALARPGGVEAMARFGIRPSTPVVGTSLTDLRTLARRIGRDHRLAVLLWDSGVHEGRLLAALVADPARVDEALMERWVSGFDSWDVCDVVCGNLFDRTAFAHAKALEWSARGEEFVKRAGFATMASLAVHDRSAPDGAFEPFLRAIEREADDDRNFVKKAVSWALRQIGKRNGRLHGRALATARQVEGRGTRAARWIARDAIRELESDAVRERLARRR